MATCRSCGAEIIWKHTKAGNAMPLDAKPVSMAAMLEDGDTVDLVRVYMPHWATCPYADSHRRQTTTHTIRPDNKPENHFKTPKFTTRNPATGAYYCTVCGVNEVDAEAGFDTCVSCLKRE